MTTREMLQLLKGEGYPIKVLARQAGVQYLRVHRHVNGSSVLSDDDKAALWCVGRQMPTVECALLHELADDLEGYE